MRALIATLALSACVAPESDSMFPTELTWDWTTEGACVYPAIEDRESVEEAARLWAEWQVSITRAPGGNVDAYLCLSPGNPRWGYVGWADIRPGQPALVELNSTIATWVSGPLWAHELGHVVLYPGTGHHTGTGILSPHVQIRRDWSPDDRDFLVSLGFESP